MVLNIRFDVSFIVKRWMPIQRKINNPQIKGLSFATFAHSDLICYIIPAQEIFTIHYSLNTVSYL